MSDNQDKEKKNTSAPEQTSTRLNGSSTSTGSCHLQANGCSVDMWTKCLRSTKQIRKEEERAALQKYDVNKRRCRCLRIKQSAYYRVLYVRIAVLPTNSLQWLVMSITPNCVHIARVLAYVLWRVKRWSRHYEDGDVTFVCCLNKDRLRFRHCQTHLVLCKLGWHLFCQTHFIIS